MFEVGLMLHIFMNRANLQGSPCARGAQSFFFGVKIETLTWANITLNFFLAWSVIKKICYNLIQIQLLQHLSNNNWCAYCQQSLVLYFLGFWKMSGLRTFNYVTCSECGFYRKPKLAQFYNSRGERRSLIQLYNSHIVSLKIAHLLLLQCIKCQLLLSHTFPTK